MHINDIYKISNFLIWYNGYKFNGYNFDDSNLMNTIWREKNKFLDTIMNHPLSQKIKRASRIQLTSIYLAGKNIFTGLYFNLHNFKLVLIKHKK